jgi:hypothetical protein
MVSWITSTYNTGWMNGDIKLATLSDTDDTDVTANNYVTGQNYNYDVDTSTGSWVVQSSATKTYDASNGVGGTGCIKLTSSGGSNVYASMPITGLTAGVTYLFTADIKAASYGPTALKITDDAYGSNPIVSWTAYPDTTYQTTSIMFTATDSTEHFSVYAMNGTNIAMYVDNITVSIPELDRSVNGNGLQVFGTVTKNPVATGADLVAYSGFSASNYLQQPYNSDLDFGTGDFCVMGWIKKSLSGRVLFERLGADQDGLAASPTDATGRLYIFTSGDNFYTLLGTASSVDSNFFVPDYDNWYHICFLRSNGVARFYANGRETSSYANTHNLGASDHISRIGTGIPYNTAPYSGSVALFRISATAPTAEQIAKIYEDEKVLFQEGAQATLYGSSDAVTALAYDDTTDLLHVGTSAGRSDFSGLRRVSNTTDAVGTAISASNGLIVEE